MADPEGKGDLTAEQSADIKRVEANLAEFQRLRATARS
jgi:hypothetical protein